MRGNIGVKGVREALGGISGREDVLARSARCSALVRELRRPAPELEERQSSALGRAADSHSFTSIRGEFCLRWSVSRLDVPTRLGPVFATAFPALKRSEPSEVERWPSG